MPETNSAPAPVAGTSTARGLPELLSPAGDWDCARAAVENGADAIYFGLARFNARMRARNFTEADLPQLMEFLHRRGVKGYVTLNTLVFENELPEARQYLRTMIACGVDAVIVQDAGICRLIRSLSPDFPIHASTQMTVTSAAGVEFARDLGCQLVVLARECSIREIAKILDTPAPPLASPSTAPDPDPPANTAHAMLPLEVFVHGALCVAYSGQCLTSEALGGRSANRGECAQACRMPYELISDGKLVPLGDRKYLLSPQDLAGLEVLPDLVHAGVASLKIEGRLKSPEYVANITRIYREALNSLAEGRESKVEGRSSLGSRVSTLDSRPARYEMEMAFSRGLHTGWFGGINNQQLVHARFGKKRGVYLGRVACVHRDRVELRLEAPLKPGDGVVFDAGNPEQAEEGGRVYEVRSQKAEGRRESMTVLGFGRGDVDFNRVHAGDRLWKTSDPELERGWRRSFAGDTPKFQRPIEVEVHGAPGQPLTVIVRDYAGHVAQAQSTMPLAAARKQPLTAARLREQFGRLGGTPFRLGELKNFLPDGLVLPVSELNRMRRETVAELERQRAQPEPWTLRDDASTSALRWGEAANPAVRDEDARPTGNAQLIVLVRSLAQLDAVLQQASTTIYCDFEDPKKYRDAVTTFRAWQAGHKNQASEIFVAPPRVFKSGEEWTLEQVRSCHADGYLVRNYDHLRFFAHDRRVGDYSLNVANSFAADHFKNRFGLERLTASYDLNFQQLEALLLAAAPEWFEVTVHQHMPMFHMEHCVFCAFLSSGTDFTNCGRPCDRHDVKLRDRTGAEHPLKADAGCRNTVYNSRAQTGAEYVAKMLALGLRHFRIEFVNESPEQVALTMAQYRRLLNGEVSGADLWRELKLVNQLGVTRGQMAGARS